MTEPRHVYESIRDGLEQARAYHAGEPFDGYVRIHRPIDVAAVRGSTGLTQAAFAKRYGIALTTLRDWEQGRASPPPYGVLFLQTLFFEPEAVERARGQQPPKPPPLTVHGRRGRPRKANPAAAADLSRAIAEVEGTLAAMDAAKTTAAEPDRFAGVTNRRRMRRAATSVSSPAKAKAKA